MFLLSITLDIHIATKKLHHTMNQGRITQFFRRNMGLYFTMCVIELYLQQF